MNHFDGITPDQRWKNEVLNELRELNKLLREQKPVQEKPKEPVQINKRPYNKRTKGAS